MKQRTTISLCALAVLALFVMTATNHPEKSSGLRGLQNANSTSTAAQAANVTANASQAAKANATAAPKVVYTSISIKKARNNSQAYHAFVAGLNGAANQLENQGKIPTADYTVTQWTSAAFRNTSTGVYYKFAANLVGVHGYVHLVLEPVVFYSLKNKNYRLTTYSYTIKNATKANFAIANNSANHAANATKAANSTSANNATANTSADHNVPVTINTTLLNPPAAAANNTQKASNSSAAAQNNNNGYTAINVSKVVNGTRAEAALSYAAENLIKTLIKQNKIPVADPHYKISHLASAFYKNETHGVRYDFKADLVNALNYKVNAELVVDYLSAHGNFSVVEYIFKTSGFKSSDLVQPNNTNHTAQANATSVAISNSTGGK